MTPPNRPRPPAKPGARPAARTPAQPASSLGRVHAAKPRAMHFLMRDGTAIEGTVQVGENQSLVSFMNSRSGWMSVTKAKRAGTDEAPGHMIIHADHIVMASSPDGAVHLTTAGAGTGVERLVELVLVGGRVVRGYVPGALGQRLSECVAASGKFVGISLARLFPEGTDVGDVVLQNSALEIVRDLRITDSEAAE